MGRGHDMDMDMVDMEMDMDMDMGRGGSGRVQTGQGRPGVRRSRLRRKAEVATLTCGGEEGRDRAQLRLNLLRDHLVERGGGAAQVAAQAEEANHPAPARLVGRDSRLLSGSENLGDEGGAAAGEKRHGEF